MRIGYQARPTRNSSPSSPIAPKSKKVKSTPNKSAKSDPGSPNNSRPKFNGLEPMEWNADGREALIDYLISEGLKGKDKAILAEKFGVTKQKIHNELSLGRTGNMRSKATKAARE